MITKHVNITLKKETIEKTRELAKKEGRSFSNMVERILQLHYNKAQPASTTMKNGETS